MALSPPPATSVPDPAGDYARAQSWSLVTSKYADAGNWATWAANLLSGYVTSIQNLLGQDAVTADLAAVTAALDAIDLYTPPVGAFTYTAPTVPTYTAIPSYSAPTLGSITAVPAIANISVGAAPSTMMTFTNTDFSDSLLDSLKGRLAADIATSSTGLGNAEAALFARETARQNAARAAAYTEVTNQFSARGFDVPPGALLAKQTEMNNESGIRLSDSSSQIMAESARLAVDYNKHVLTQSSQLLEALARVFDSKVVRDFEVEKTRVQLALEGFKETIAVELAKASLNKTAIEATISANEGTVKVFEAQINGQVAPMKAISETNQAQANAYSAAVQGATAALNAQIIPEELKIKGVEANSQIAGTKAEIALKEAMVSIESAARHLALEVTTMNGLASGAQQITASALNGVTSSASFGWNASASTNYTGT